MVAQITGDLDHALALAIVSAGLDIPPEVQEAHSNNTYFYSYSADHQ